MDNEFTRLLAELAAGRGAALRRTADGRAYTRAFAAPERLILLGAGHVSRSLAALAPTLGFAVTVADDRAAFASRERFPDAAELVVDGFADAIRALRVRSADYVCILTRGHRWDGECLRAVLRGETPYYLGMIGSRRRTAAQLAQLADEGFDPDRLRAVHTPIGLPIKALTPPEIAVSIAAELILARRSKPADPTVLERTDADEAVLRFAADGDTPKALLLVLEREGSAPARTGSLMVVDRAGRSAGTIGGCCEAAALLRAARLIGTGRSELFTADLTSDAAADEGMACGGTMKILIEDICNEAD